MVDKTIKYPQMHEAFPDFDQASLPEIPPSWTDVSWLNDGCPSFNTNEGWFVWIDYEDVSLREHPNSYRFSAVDVDVDGTVIAEHGSCSTDNWEDLLKWL